MEIGYNLRVIAMPEFDRPKNLFFYRLTLAAQFFICQSEILTCKLLMNVYGKQK